MRCGCTNTGSGAIQCPPCPQTVYYNDMDLAVAVTVDSGVASVTQIAVLMNITVPAIVPGFGALIWGELVLGAQDDQENISLTWNLGLDNTVIQRRPISPFSYVLGSDDQEAVAINGVVPALTPGVHAFTLTVIASAAAGTPVLILEGGSLMVQLLRTGQIVEFP